MRILVDTSVWSLALRKVASYFEPFPLLRLDRSSVEAAARLFRSSRSKGVSASTVNWQIAATAIEHECLLLTADRDFERLAAITDLRLA